MTNDSFDYVFPLKGNEVISDSFDTPTIDSAWVRVDGASAGHTTWTQQQGVMSANHPTTTDAQGAIHALMRPISAGASYPYTLECFAQHAQIYNTSYVMVGMIMADGISVGSGVQDYAMHYAASGQGMATQPTVHALTGYNAYGGSSVGSPGYLGVMYGGYHHRFTWTASNSFQSAASMDGINWHYSSTHSYTLTPTYVGIAVTNWTTTREGSGGFYYFRAYEGADPQAPSDTL